MGPLMDFFKKHEPTIDVFCLQEMHNMSAAYREEHYPDEYWWPKLLSYVRDALPNHWAQFACWKDEPDRRSVALFIRRGVPVREWGNEIIPLHQVQYAILAFPERDILVINAHWILAPDIRAFMGSFALPTVLCGDFDSVPGMVDLVKRDGIRTTRRLGSLLVSPGIKADSKVLSDECSGYAPLSVEISL
jgi:hypothetical protein